MRYYSNNNNNNLILGKDLGKSNNFDTFQQM